MSPEDRAAVRRIERLRLPSDIRDELRARQWEGLAALAKEMARRCDNAAFAERKTPGASGMFNEITRDVLADAQQFITNLDQITDDRIHEVDR